MQETIDLIAKYGYVILFLYSLGGGFVALIGASVLSFAGKMDLTFSIIVAVIANFIGDLMLFYIARYQKAMMQPYFAKHRRKLALVHILMRKYGSIIIVIKKYIYGLKTLVPLAIALTPYSLAKFNLYNAIGAVVWGVSIGLLGYFSGGILIKTFETLSEYPLLAPLFIAALLGGLWLWLSRATKRN
ncbi:DedA family protein [Helicobacter turcicus]|uniref:VTT domain-containing protein n=1 Tax=Helicobacter turcicus TaxID=2867412 RepID=A0ABS7JKI4_9HELI|nr:VTT domain-containing protein [Helicobacter turcicus]MBX7489897.1 VTT domain-containing protein [Helicobacter turcicus]MBX7544757.1 VTT domain-containing protein [Helicobacter turcicus]